MKAEKNIAAIALAVLLACGGGGCTAILDFEEAQCWCGEQWKVQISGANATNVFGEMASIPASKTTYLTCVSQLEHLALEAADPQDPLYVALQASLQSAAIAKCEAAGPAIWPITFASTDCASAGTEPVSVNIVHLGACWETEDWDNDAFCPLFPECEPYYDCSQEPVWDGGGDEAGGEVQWECEETIAFTPLDQLLLSPTGSR